MDNGKAHNSENNQFEHDADVRKCETCVSKVSLKRDNYVSEKKSETMQASIFVERT